MRKVIILLLGLSLMGCLEKELLDQAQGGAAQNSCVQFRVQSATTAIDLSEDFSLDNLSFPTTDFFSDCQAELSLFELAENLQKRGKQIRLLLAGGDFLDYELRDDNVVSFIEQQQAEIENCVVDFRSQFVLVPEEGRIDYVTRLEWVGDCVFTTPDTSL